MRWRATRCPPACLPPAHSRAHLPRTPPTLDTTQEKEPLPEYRPPAQAPAARVQPTFDASEGRRDAHGRLVFADVPHFRPNLTPAQVIRAGSFGG